jgi:hypothetical protein
MVEIELNPDEPRIGSDDDNEGIDVEAWKKYLRLCLYPGSTIDPTEINRAVTQLQRHNGLSEEDFEELGLEERGFKMDETPGNKDDDVSSVE